MTTRALFGAVAALAITAGLFAGGTDPTGACCMTDASCISQTEKDCVSSGGTYQGDLSDCGSINCPAPPTCSGDANADDVVDVQDLILLVQFWGPCGSNCVADFNGDDAHDVTDMLAIFFAWGACPDTP